MMPFTDWGGVSSVSIVVDALGPQSRDVMKLTLEPVSAAVPPSWQAPGSIPAELSLK